jgi:Na+/H+ antiporter NhaD/arsenite permease-like protein
MKRYRRPLLTLFFLLVSVITPAAASEGLVPVNPLMILPFVCLLLAIAVAPFINKHWWEKNYPLVSVGLGLVTVAYYLFGLENPTRLLHTAEEYLSFIALIGSLFVVAGGIHIQIRGKSTPLANVSLLAIGAVVSNIVGTTGASMILIRPFLRVNRYRIRPYHVVFFIFIVSNMGGSLTPIGDPPLFLGYLKGIPFFWVAEAVWLPWLVAMVLVLGVFYLVDSLAFQRLQKTVQREAEDVGEEGLVKGLHNVAFLVVILVAVFITKPPFVRELLMLLAAAASYFSTGRAIHEKNAFNFVPIKEVGILFLGIFATMIPALDWLELNASKVGIQTAGQFFWATGSLSSFLDNAPTYLNFLSASFGLFVRPDIVDQVQHLVQTHGAGLGQVSGPYAAEIRNTYETLLKFHYDLVSSGNVPWDDIATSYMIGNHSLYLLAISLGAVFFGAMTYIGNGPNFMVKSIADQAGISTPSFFGYMARYSLPVLVPIFAITWFFFLRN